MKNFGYHFAFSSNVAERAGGLVRSCCIAESLRTVLELSSLLGWGEIACCNFVCCSITITCLNLDVLLAQDAGPLASFAVGVMCGLGAPITERIASS